MDEELGIRDEELGMRNELRIGISFLIPNS